MVARAVPGRAGAAGHGGVLVEQHRITLSKPRQSEIGMTLEGFHMCSITRMTEAASNGLQAGDMIGAVNGKFKRGAINTARAIRWASRGELQVWRPVAARH